MLLRRVARPMLAAVFVSNGIELLTHRERRAEIASRLELGGADPQQATLAASGVMFGAGLLLATNRAPRLAALLLAGALVPTTLAAHPFWAEKDQQARREQRGKFLSDVGLLGGLLISLTGGRRRRSGPITQARKKIG